MKARNIIEKDRATENEHNIIFLFSLFLYDIVIYSVLNCVLCFSKFPSSQHFVFSIKHNMRIQEGHFLKIALNFVLIADSESTQNFV